MTHPVRYVRRMGRWSAAVFLAFACGCSEPTGIEIRTETLIVTQDPAVFAGALARIDNENEVIVTMKDASEPGVDLEIFQGPDVAGVYGLPDRPADTFTRTEPYANASPASRQALIDAVDAVGAEVYGHLSAPIIFVRIPDAVRLDAVRVLMSHENLDFMSANRGVDGTFDGG